MTIAAPTAFPSESGPAVDDAVPPLRLTPVPPVRQGFTGPDLSPREREVLRVWLRVDTKREVTEHLFIAGSTVSTYIQRIRAKYESVGRPARTKARLLIRALEDGIVDIDDL